MKQCVIADGGSGKGSIYRTYHISFMVVYSLQAGSFVENGALSKFWGLGTKHLYFDSAPFSTKDPACMLEGFQFFERKTNTWGGPPSLHEQCVGSLTS